MAGIRHCGDAGAVDRRNRGCPGVVSRGGPGPHRAATRYPYRPGGWTVRQVVHHVADSHLHSYIRFRLALTEDQPTIKPYDQDKWAELPDARTAPVETSLRLIESLHQRWVLLLRSMSDADFARTFLHPSGASCAWMSPWPCTPGTAATIGRISLGCGSAWAGNNSYNQTSRGRVQLGGAGGAACQGIMA